MTDVAPWVITFARVWVSVVLVFLAICHALWAFGLWWPARNEDRLVAAVVAVRRATRMPGAVPCLFVATGLAIGAALPWVPPDWAIGRWTGAVAALLAIVFALRGAVVLLPPWRRATEHEPFATLDRRLYAPVSFLLALAFWLISMA